MDKINLGHVTLQSASTYCTSSHSSHFVRKLAIDRDRGRHSDTSLVE